MSRLECQQLEAHLSGNLSEHEATRFTAHLTACEPCRTAIAQQAWLEGLLRDSATAEAVPAGVTLAIDRAIIRTRRRRQFAYGFAATAAAVLIAVGLRTSQPAPTENRPQLAVVEQPAPVATPIATFVGSDDMIVVTHDSPYPNVTIVEVYPTVTARRRWKREAAARSLPVPKQFPGDPS
ncbi:MAG: hypothetical protein GXP24_06280 [Planctomycetes bacterium]|nr:hypothetical protein [Planctomycetota bacterium]